MAAIAWRVDWCSRRCLFATVKRGCGTTFASQSAACRCCQLINSMPQSKVIDLRAVFDESGIEHHGQARCISFPIQHLIGSDLFLEKRNDEVAQSYWHFDLFDHFCSRRYSGRRNSEQSVDQCSIGWSAASSVLTREQVVIDGILPCCPRP